MKPTGDENDSESGNWVGDYERLQQLVAQQQLEDCVVVHKMDVTKDLSAFLEDHRYMRFKLAFIDCGVRDVITKSLECLWPRLVKGGILIMDHYNTTSLRWRVSSSSSALAIDRFKSSRSLGSRRAMW